MFIIDFEITIYNSIIHIFENTSINCCIFHFNQIFIRFMNENGINDDFIYDLNNKKYVKYLLLLVYGAIDKIDHVFRKILKLKQENSSYDNYRFFWSHFLSFSKIKNKERKIWSVYYRIINDISSTTNSCEAYHRYLNSKKAPVNFRPDRNFTLF
ncbi:hypothetical protein DMUE_0376 [Dictyocoela muelleri]|nr:hypothetical protein DMUE_0376 [Dictyocoela muelleri]